jgi:hypothetical protein
VIHSSWTTLKMEAASFSTTSLNVS